MKFLFILLFSISAHGNELVVNLTKLRSDKGKIAIVVFNSKKGFPDKTNNAVFRGFISVQDFPYKIILPKGEYAISLFHDENNNQKLDTNFFGIPKEPFGFSNNKVGLMGPPSYEKSKFKASNETNLINIEMKKY